VAGYSIPASEHSTITAWGREGEAAAMKNMLEQYPTGLVACVSDSYDVYKACSELWGGELKDAVMARDGVLVVRPDSGEPASTSLKVLELLGAKFGTETNSKGYKVLDSHVRIIWGDGIDMESLCYILATLKAHGWSADNIAFGSGGGLLQKLNRDTQRCAFKCSAITIDGEDRDVFKDPITDKGKMSKKGRLALVKEGGTFVTKTSCPREGVPGDALHLVFEDGEVVVDQSFADVRARAALPPLDELPLLGSSGGLLGLVESVKSTLAKLI